MLLSNDDVDTVCNSIVINSFRKKLPCSHLFLLLYQTGLRFNDVALCFNSTHDENTFTIQPSKHNNLRTINFKDVNNSFISFVKGVDSFYYRQSYSSVIRFLKMCNPMSNLRINKKEIHTHIFRHNYMKKLFSSGHSISDICTITGEKQITSAVNYIFSSIYSNI